MKFIAIFVRLEIDTGLHLRISLRHGSLRGEKNSSQRAYHQPMDSSMIHNLRKRAVIIFYQVYSYIRVYLEACYHSPEAVYGDVHVLQSQKVLRDGFPHSPQEYTASLTDASETSTSADCRRR